MVAQSKKQTFGHCKIFLKETLLIVNIADLSVLLLRNRPRACRCYVKQLNKINHCSTNGLLCS